MEKKELEEIIERLETCAAIFQTMMECCTINLKQQNELASTAKKRVNCLLELSDVPSKRYEAIYLDKLWNEFCSTFYCRNYKDLNPVYMVDDVAIKWIQKWEYIDCDDM